MSVKTVKRVALRSLVFALVFSLAGCGFQLKGIKQAGSASIYPVYEDGSAAFRQVFQQILLENGQLATNPETADIHVFFLKEEWQRRSLSVTGTGIPAEYRLQYFLSYKFTRQVERRAENQRSENQSTENQSTEKYREISQSRDFVANNAQLLAVDSEQSHLKRQLQQRVAYRVIQSLK